MAQSLVTYLGGAVKSSSWLEAAADPSQAYHFFEDGHSAAAFSADTSLNPGIYGRINASPGTAATSTTSLHVVCNAPQKFAFECKGAFQGNATGGIVGIAEVASNARAQIASDEGAYFYVDSGTLKFRVRTGASDAHVTRDVPLGGASLTAERRYGFSFDGGVFRVYVNGAEVAQFASTFPPGDQRFVAGKRDSIEALANQFVSFDYVLISGNR